MVDMFDYQSWLLRDDSTSSTLNSDELIFCTAIDLVGQSCGMRFPTISLQVVSKIITIISIAASDELLDSSTVTENLLHSSHI